MTRKRKHQALKGHQKFVLMALLTGALNKEQTANKLDALIAWFGTLPWHHKESSNINGTDNRLIGIKMRLCSA